ncbi:MAG: hydantoinase/oxoprolinase family protein [Rhodospirillaceae bacterium]|nr:hydantoinase/oxoprolinase family protein [Rhodospirillaceae bacterium]
MPTGAAGEARPRYRLAVDVGGTFTDVVIADERGRGLSAAKVPTTPHDRALGVMDGIRAAAAAEGIGLDGIAEVVHGSTTGTNALIERSGAKVGFLTTAGFRDMLEIGRVQRPMEGLYDFTVDRPPPLVPRHRCLEAVERIDAEGRIVTPLDEASVAVAAEVFAGQQVEAVAVCFLFAHLNPAHEDRAAEILGERLPGVPISVSNRMSPEYREYERASTAVMNAYLTPVMDEYLGNLEARIAEAAGRARLSVIQANGGSTSVAQARRKAVTTVNSGPCGGVVAAALYGRRHARERMVSVDMGGTSFDIGLIEEGRSRVTTEGDFQGLPVKIPIIDLHIIGAGGGSIAWIDPGGALNVGPQSAGAVPGPACYGRGGSEATVTDANLALGRLNPDNFNAGRMALDRDAAKRAVSALAEKMGASLEEAALGVVRVVNANMTRGIATVTIQRGIDVRDFSLVSFGGAGGAHAVALAEELSMAEAIVPPMPGTFSAVGLLATEMRHDYVTATGGIVAAQADTASLEAAFRAMEKQGRDLLAEQGFADERIRLTRLADLKVVGQTYELLLPLPERGTVTEAGIAALVADFGALYRERYAFFFEDEPIEIVNLRLSAEGLNPPVDFPESAGSGESPEAAQSGSRPVYFDGPGWTETPIFERSRLAHGMMVPGPAVIEEETSATLVPPGRRAEVAADLGLIVGLRGP